jgi:hypothetical protein
MPVDPSNVPLIQSIILLKNLITLDSIPEEGFCKSTFFAKCSGIKL